MKEINQNREHARRLHPKEIVENPSSNKISLQIGDSKGYLSKDKEVNKFVYFNDTKSDVHIHPATELQGVKCDMSVIKPFAVREFYLPKGTYAWLKQWEDKTIFVSGKKI